MSLISIYSKNLRFFPAAISCCLLLIFIHTSFGQYARDSSRFTEEFQEGVAILKDRIEDHPDVRYDFDPSDRLLPANSYTFSFPDIEDYRIGILMDPCRGNSHDCCMNIFGTPEYPSLKNPNLEQERANPIEVIADEKEIQARYNLIIEDGEQIRVSAIRRADDEYYLAPECISLYNPFTYCLGKRFGARVSPLKPRCVDNNSSLNTLSGCVHPNGTAMEKCAAIAYTQNAFIGLCGSNYADDDHCGTFIEIHMRHGSPYNAETEIISQVKIDTRNVSGYYTTIIPMTWMGDPSRILCAYYQDYFRVGSIVYVNPTAPRCCCPPIYDSASRKGSFICPIGTGAAQNGPLARAALTTANLLARDANIVLYPWCRSGLEDPDVIMCSVIDEKTGRAYTRRCKDVTNVTMSLYGSPDMSQAGAAPAGFTGVCPYFSNCVLTRNPIDRDNIGAARNRECGENRPFSFIGLLGRVVAIDTKPFIPVLTVTFNNGRTTYEFEQDVLKLEYQRSMYEFWWVQRTRSEFIVQKRKGFNVTEPICSFDLTNDRYFPWAVLDEDGKPID